MSALHARVDTVYQVYGIGVAVCLAGGAAYYNLHNDSKDISKKVGDITLEQTAAKERETKMAEDLTKVLKKLTLEQTAAKERETKMAEDLTKVLKKLKI